MKGRLGPLVLCLIGLILMTFIFVMVGLFGHG